MQKKCPFCAEISSSVEVTLEITSKPNQKFILKISFNFFSDFFFLGSNKSHIVLLGVVTLKDHMRAALDQIEP